MRLHLIIKFKNHKIWNFSLATFYGQPCFDPRYAVGSSAHAFKFACSIQILSKAYSNHH
jgi:hypothetical protein